MTKTSCGTLLSAGRGRMTQDTRDTCWPCRTDAACCVPVGPGGKPQIGNCPAPGWKHILLQGRWLADCLQPGELGYTKVFSKGQMTLFTASLGILGIESQWGRYSFHIMQRPCSSLMIFIWMFWQVSISSVMLWNAAWHWWSIACWKVLRPRLFLSGCNLWSDWPCHFGPPNRAEHWGLRPTSTKAFNNRCHAVDTWQVATQHFAG